MQKEKRKQANLDTFFQVPKKQKKISEDNALNNLVSRREDQTLVDLTGVDGEEGRGNTNSEQRSARNAFQVLMKNSQLINKRHRAVFFLEFKEGKFHPEFIIEESRIVPLIENSEKYWSCETNLTNFRWFCFPKGYREVQLYLVSNLRPAFTQSKATYEEDSQPKIHPSLMKSMLQKGVRRRLTVKVMKLSRQFSVENAMELLRRMIIICVEDVMLHPSIPIIAWLMVALTKGYIFHDIFSSMCVLVLSDFCIAPYRDCYPPEATIEEMIQCINLSFTSDLQTTASPQSPNSHLDTGNLPSLYEIIQNSSWRTVIASLFIRASYGGMDFDRVMLEKYGLLWSMRVLSFQNFGDASLKSTSIHATSLADFKLPLYLSADYVEMLTISCPWGLEMLRNFFSFNTNIGSIEMDLPPEKVLLVRISSALEESLLKLKDKPFLLQQFKPTSVTEYLASTEDIVIEGIDFHCDWNLLASVIENCKPQLTKYFQSHQTMVNLDSFHDLNNKVEITVPANYSKELSSPEKDKLESYLKSLIWIFRSSINTHKLWPFLYSTPVTDKFSSSPSFSSPMKISSSSLEVPLIHFNELQSHQYYEENTLVKKDRLAGLWAIICPAIKTYCDQRIRRLKF